MSLDIEAPLVTPFVDANFQLRPVDDANGSFLMRLSPDHAIFHDTLERTAHERNFGVKISPIGISEEDGWSEFEIKPSDEYFDPTFADHLGPLAIAAVNRANQIE